MKKTIHIFALLFLCPLALFALEKEDIKTIPYDVDYYLDEVLPHGGTISREDLNGGFLISSVTSGTHNAVRAMVIQTDGRILGIGRTSYGAGGTANNGIGIIRYHPDGQLDTSYNTTGLVFSTFGPSGDDLVHGAALTTDGYLAVVGKTNNGSGGSYDFAIQRFTTSGVLDTAFSSDGKLTIDFGNAGDIARGVAVDTSGRYVVAGYSLANGSSFAVAMARVLSGGVLDTTFDSDGMLTKALTAQDSFALALAIQTDGRIVTAGPAHNGTSFLFGVARFDSNGVIDTAFQTSGKALYSFTGSETLNTLAYAVGITTTADIAVGGFRADNSGVPSNRLVIARIKSNGILDTSFNSKGSILTNVNSGADGAIFALQVLQDDRILGAGFAMVSGSASGDDIVLMRVGTNGALDTAFNSTGLVTQTRAAPTALSGIDRIQAIGYYTDSQIFVGGRTANGTLVDFAIIRYNWDGTVKKSGDLDLSFGT